MLTFEELNNRLRNVQETVILEQDFAKFLILPHSGRIIGVSLNGDNLLWVNPNPRDTLMSDNWNIGGIRTWISPERNYFYRKPDTFEEWFCPVGIDPANYKIISKEDSTIKLVSDIEAKNNLTGDILKGILTKKIDILSTGKVGVQLYAKIRIHSILQLHSNHPNVSLWSIIQVPVNDQQQSKVIFPLNVANLIPYFLPVPEDYLNYTEESIEFILDGEKELKLGIPPEDFPNPQKIDFSYHYNLNGKHVSISLNSNTSASTQEECLDVAKYSPNGLKGVIQFYNSDYSTSSLRYGELEFHSKPTKKVNGILMTENIINIDFSLKH